MAALVKKLMKPRRDTRPLLEGLLAALPQPHDRAHVDLVEGGEHRRRLLRLDQPLGDGLAPAGDAHPSPPTLALPSTEAAGAGCASPSRSGSSVCSGAAGLDCSRIRRSTSSRVMRPPEPLPVTSAMSTSYSWASFLTEGRGAAGAVLDSLCPSPALRPRPAAAAFCSSSACGCSSLFFLGLLLRRSGAFADGAYDLADVRRSRPRLWR